MSGVICILAYNILSDSCHQSIDLLQSHGGGYFAGVRQMESKKPEEQPQQQGAASPDKGEKAKSGSVALLDYFSKARCDPDSACVPSPAFP